MTTAQIEARARRFGFSGVALLTVAGCLVTFPLVVCLALADAVLVALWRRCQPAAVVLGVTASLVVVLSVAAALSNDPEPEYRWNVANLELDR